MYSQPLGDSPPLVSKHYSHSFHGDTSDTPQVLLLDLITLMIMVSFITHSCGYGVSRSWNLRNEREFTKSDTVKLLVAFTLQCHASLILL